MNKSFMIGVLLALFGTLAAACGGNVIVDKSGAGGSGTGGAGSGGNTNTITAVDKCQELADLLIAKYEECGIVVSSGSTGSAECTPESAQLAACLESCIPLIDCACIKDPTGPGCADKLKPYTDCANGCVQ